MNLKVSEWKPFNIMRTESQRGLFEIENCKCGNAGELDDGIDINYIGAKKSDNGVMRSVSLEGNSELVSKGHGIMFICDGEGSVGYTNYMDSDFIGSTTTSIGYDDALTETNAMFLVSVLDSEKFKYSYGRKYRKNLTSAIIYLPVQQNANGSIIIDSSCKYSDEGYVPDWQFMECYIKSLHHKPITTKNKLGRTSDLKVNEWKEFRVGDLFTVELSKGDIKADESDEGEIILISSGEKDNGVVKHIDRAGDGKAEVFDGNKITVDMFGNVYYQPEQFYAVSHGRVNILSAKFDLNISIGLFIATVIGKEKFKYSYGRAIYSDEAFEMIIKLPVQQNADGSIFIDSSCKYSDEGYVPDWQFMENYIKALPYGDRLNG